MANGPSKADVAKAVKAFQRELDSPGFARAVADAVAWECLTCKVNGSPRRLVDAESAAFHQDMMGRNHEVRPRT